MKYTDEELLDILIQFYEKNGRIPICADFDSNKKYPAVNTYIKRFGSWNKAIELVGLQVNCFTKRTDKELLEYLKHFYEDNGRPPSRRDFINNPKYPGFYLYIRRFGTWHNTLKLVGLDVDSMIRKGIIENEQQKGRFWELKILEHLGNNAIDLSGKNCVSQYDGICPKGQIYDAKSSKLHNEKFWTFGLNNADRDNIEWYYIGAFDKDYKKILHVWRVPGDFIEGNSITIGIDSSYTYNMENMKKYEITDKFNKILDMKI